MHLNQVVVVGVCVYSFISKTSVQKVFIIAQCICAFMHVRIKQEIENYTFSKISIYVKFVKWESIAKK